MAKRKRDPELRLGAGELELLEVLWREKAVTISEAQAALERPQGYTTVQTRLERLVAKGVASKSIARPAKYKPAISAEEVSRDDLKLLVRRVTGGRVTPLIAHLVNDRPLSREEAKQIRALIAAAEARSKGEADAK